MDWLRRFVNSTQLALLTTLLCSVTSQDYKNVLFIVVDDLRPQLGVYSGDFAPTPVSPPMHTPNIDLLASNSLLLTRAYVQFPQCAPSRSSFLTGRRPETLQTYDNGHNFRDVANFTTLPQFFKENGYFSTGLGKIFHRDENELQNWSDDFYDPEDPYGYIENSWQAITPEQIAENPLVDQLIVEEAIQRLRNLAPAAISGEQLFFMAVGLNKPHLKFIYPQEYEELYPEEIIRMPQTQSVPVGFPIVAWDSCWLLCDLPDINKTCAYNESVGERKTLELRRAYYSCVSYTDGLVGQLLGELDALGLRNDTVVVFIGDHGWELGEHNEWCKMTNFEESLQTPAIIRIPGLTDEGLVTTKLTEFVDLFPTMVEAAGLEPLSLCSNETLSEEACREGTSLMALVEDPERDDWKQRVFSQNMRDSEDSGYPFNVMGFSMRDTNFRYSEWVRFNLRTNEPDWDTMLGTELYDLNHDSEETVNIADNPAYQEIVETMSDQLRRGWRDDTINQPE